jgi:hypothetical protein
MSPKPRYLLGQPSRSPFREHPQLQRVRRTSAQVQRPGRSGRHPCHPALCRREEFQGRRRALEARPPPPTCCGVRRQPGPWLPARLRREKHGGAIGSLPARPTVTGSPARVHAARRLPRSADPAGSPLRGDPRFSRQPRNHKPLTSPLHAPYEPTSNPTPDNSQTDNQQVGGGGRADKTPENAICRIMVIMRQFPLTTRRRVIHFTTPGKRQARTPRRRDIPTDGLTAVAFRAQPAERIRGPWRPANRWEHKNGQVRLNQCRGEPTARATREPRWT